MTNFMYAAASAAFSCVARERLETNKKGQSPDWPLPDSV